MGDIAKVNEQEEEGKDGESRRWQRMMDDMTSMNE